MILVADAMRQVFDGGQSLALLGESVAVVLCDRDVMLARRARLLCNFIDRQIDIDPRSRYPDRRCGSRRCPLRTGRRWT